MKALIPFVIMGFVFWSGPVKTCKRTKNKKLECTVSAGLFRGNPQTGEIEEFVRFKDEYEQQMLDGSSWILIKESLGKNWRR